MLLVDIIHIPVVFSLAATVSVLCASVVLSVLIKPKGVTGSAYPFKPKEDSPDSRAER